MSKRARTLAAYVRFLRERRWMSFEGIASRLRLDPEVIEDAYDDALAQGVKPERPA
jgi:hypothetical protein